MRESPVGESNDTLNEVEEGRPLLAGSRGCAVDASGNVNANGVVSGEVTIGKKGKEVDVTLRMNISVTCDVSLSIGANMLAASLDRLKGTSLESHQPVISALAVIVAILMLAHVFAGALGLQRAITERVHMLGQAVWFAVVAVVTIMSCLREEELGKYGGIGLTADF
ncbi:hypothetical protein HK101_009006 [Irineochytrium annulatum]|nr:hypothetical protein HK101_009006 [Irineochytrium annulatum]